MDEIENLRKSLEERRQRFIKQIELLIWLRNPAAKQLAQIPFALVALTFFMVEHLIKNAAEAPPYHHAEMYADIRQELQNLDENMKTLSIYL